MKLKKLTAVFAILMVFTVSFLTLFPAVVAVSDKKGSITLNLVDSETKKPLANESFRLYFVAKASETNNGVRYELVSPYDKANIDMKDLQDSSLPIHLTFFAISNSQAYAEKSTDENGKLVFDNLNPGLYLVVPSQNASVSPFVISVPQYNSEIETWEYNVVANPKNLDGNEGGNGTDAYISVVKKWETDKTHPESVTVVLLRDFQEYEKVELNESNNWHYRWDNLEENHVWNVVEADVPDGYTVYYETSSNTVTIINKSDSSDSPIKPPEQGEEDDKLVQTGQLNWPVPVCAISGLLIFSIGWAILNFNKKESQ